MSIPTLEREEISEYCPCAPGSLLAYQQLTFVGSHYVVICCEHCMLVKMRDAYSSFRAVYVRW